MPVSNLSVPNLAASRFILECFFNELETHDRDIAVASGLRVGEVADALLAFLCDREIARLTLPKTKRRGAPRRTKMPQRSERQPRRRATVRSRQ